MKGIKLSNLIILQIGYLYLTDAKRLEDVMLKLGFLSGASMNSILKDSNSEPPFHLQVQFEWIIINMMMFMTSFACLRVVESDI